MNQFEKEEVGMNAIAGLVIIFAVLVLVGLIAIPAYFINKSEVSHPLRSKYNWTNEVYKDDEKQKELVDLFNSRKPFDEIDAKNVSSAFNDINWGDYLGKNGGDAIITKHRIR